MHCCSALEFNFYLITHLYFLGQAIRAGRVPGGMIVLSPERTEQSFHENNKPSECVLKNFGMISKRTERELLEKND